MNPVPQAALVIIAQENGYFRANGLKVDISRFTTGKLAFDAVLGGAADVATVADIPIMYAAMSGQKPAVLATIERSGNSVKILARKDKGIRQPSDLRGKRIATFKGSSAEFFLDRFLRKHGMTQRDVEVVQLQPPDMVAAIARGDVAAISIWEPHIHNGRSQLQAGSAVFADPDVYTETFNIASSAEYAQTAKATLIAFLRALDRAALYVKQSPDDAIARVAAFVQMDPKVLREIWPNFDLSLAADPNLPNLLREQAEFAIQSGVLAKPDKLPDFRGVIDAKILAAARAPAKP